MDACARPPIARRSVSPKEKICKRNRMLLKSPQPAGVRALPGPLRAHAMRGSSLRARTRPSSMQLPILPADAQSITEDPLALRVLYLSFGVLLAILPLAHITALRNTLVGRQE